MGDEPLRAQGEELISVDVIDGLGAWLRERAHLWKPRPFVDADVPWADALPEVVRWCADLSHDQIDHLEAQGVGDGPAVLRDIEASLARWEPRAIGGGGLGEARGVGERKRVQVAAFAAAVDVVAPIVDWCGGKGHLGRELAARSGQPVTVVDIVDYAGDLPFVHADVLRGTVDGLLHDAHGVGLHACGDLGLRLLEVGARTSRAVALAPCCLHKGQWRALSTAGRHHDPGIDHSALRLATADEVVARPALRAGRRRENGFRLGFDRLLREATGNDVYTPLGTLPHDLVRADFVSFVRGVAELRSLPLPNHWDPNESEARGHTLALRARALGLVRSRFRRGLELWVVADRAAFLHESGFAVDVVRFCDRATSPRNLLVTGHRRG